MQQETTYNNRHTTPLPLVPAIISIRLSNGSGWFKCKWVPYNPDNYELGHHPSIGYLGTAFDCVDGIGYCFFIYYYHQPPTKFC